MDNKSSLNLLSFDGGGVRGLSALIILQNLMRRVSVDPKLLPCQLFDMICGTSTGGIIAIMLGRLRMSVDDCIEAYHHLSKEIFNESWRPKGWKTSKLVLGIQGDAEERSRRLEKAICQIIDEHLPVEEKEKYLSNHGSKFDPHDVPLLVNDKPGDSHTHVIVVATQQANGQKTLLRSFESPTEVGLGFSIVEACLATAAAPLVFAPFQKTYGTTKEFLVDGGLGNNNPIQILLQESRSLWQAQKINTLISIGTGCSLSKHVGSSLVPLAKKVAEMATDASREATRFASVLRDTNFELFDNYFRLSAGLALDGIGLDEWKMLGAISQRTRSWLGDQDDELRRCALKLSEQPKPVSYEARSEHTKELSPTPANNPKVPIRAEVAATENQVPDELIITDPVAGTKLDISFWRTVRLPENGTVFDLPAGFGRFPLLDAKPFKDVLRNNGMGEAGLILPMYNREAMYMQFEVEFFNHLIPPPAFAIRPYIGGINAISGESMFAPEPIGQLPNQPAASPSLDMEPTAPPPQYQDYLVVDASPNISKVRPDPQWLDGIAVSSGRVKQFVAVPFGSNESVESQKHGADRVGGIQLEIIPTLPIDQLRKPTGHKIKVFFCFHYSRQSKFHGYFDSGDLVWDMMSWLFVDIWGGRGSSSRCMFQLQYRMHRLEPHWLLYECGIMRESTVEIVARLRGGASASPKPKRMAIAAGAMISQNVEKDRQPPNIWDKERAKIINIQIVDLLSFEQLTGIAAPRSPIGFKTYQDLKIPFFHFYQEDVEAISGNFEGISSVDAIAENSTQPSKSNHQKPLEHWTDTPTLCSKCRDDSLFRLIRPCGHALCNSCYQAIEVNLERGHRVSFCPVPGCKLAIHRVVAWPETSDAFKIQNFYTGVPIEMSGATNGVREFRSVAERPRFSW